MRLALRLYRLEVETLDALSAPLTLQQYRILDRVNSGIASMSGLAQCARRQPPTISKSVDSLVLRGLLMRGPSERDRRVALLALTPTGKGLLAEATKTVGELEVWMGAILLSIARRQDVVVAAETLYESAEERLRTPGNGQAGVPHHK